MRKISFHPLPSPTDCPLVIPNRKRSALDWGSRDYSLDSRFRGNDTFFVIPHLMRDPSPPVIPNRKRSASDWGSIPSRHPQFDWGSSPDWIPVFTGMIHPLSSPTESEALRIGDPSPPVIPSLTRDPVLTGFPFSRE